MSGRIVCVGNGVLDHVYEVEALPRAPLKTTALNFRESGGGPPPLPRSPLPASVEKQAGGAVSATTAQAAPCGRHWRAAASICRVLPS